jgi:hypothetical protein
LSERDGDGYRSDLGQRRREIFLEKGLDRNSLICPSGNQTESIQQNPVVDQFRRTCALEIGRPAGHIRPMKVRFSILLAAALLVAAILLVFRGDLHARMGEPVKQCGFWGDMEAGMSCR